MSGCTRKKLYMLLTTVVIWALFETRILISHLEERFYFVAMVLYHLAIVCIFGYIMVLVSRSFKNTINKHLRALCSSEERYRMIFNNSPLGIVYFDQRGTILHCNEKFIEITGFDREKLTGLNLLTDLKDTDISSVVNSALSGNLDSCEIVYTAAEFKKNLNLKVVFNRISYDSDDFSGVVAVIEDITEKKHMEREMARLDRLDLIGQMSASIGHEIRNPMTTVRGFLQLLGNKEDNLVNKEYYQVMIDELDRANMIITEFLSLSKNKLVKFTNGNINNIIDSVCPLILVDALEQGKNILFKNGVIPKISLNEGEIRQLIYNLVRNGLESMPQGKDLIIKTYKEDNEVVLAIQDEGSGIDPDIIDKIGTPFLTTKETGTGLGLAVCYSIAERHQAKIDFKTNLSGTTFYVRFRIPKTQLNDKIAS